MESQKKLVWWKKLLYILVLIIGLLLGGMERGGYLFSEPLSIFGYFLFYIPLISAIGFAWSKIKGESKKQDDKVTD